MGEQWGHAAVGNGLPATGVLFKSGFLSGDQQVTILLFLRTLAETASKAQLFVTLVSFQLVTVEKTEPDNGDHISYRRRGLALARK